MTRLLILFLALSSGTFAQQVAGKDDSKNLFTCSIKTEQPVYTIGETPRITVEIKNNSGKNVLLVRVLDGSEVRWRYPYAYFDIKKIGDTSYHPQKILRCGNTDNITPGDFIAVKSGESFNPYQLDSVYVTDHRLLNQHNFPAPGKYKISFYYSTNQPDFTKWLGRFAKPDPRAHEQLLGLFSKVPKFEIVSNDLIIELK